jgi:hypothetical protein
VTLFGRVTGRGGDVNVTIRKEGKREANGIDGAKAPHSIPPRADAEERTQFKFA